MINKPPVDKLVDKIGDRYALCCVVSKRARQIIEHNLAMGYESKLDPITEAAEEVYDGKIIAQND